ncbi:hypothetical protein [Mesorhizobium onobrychidis]|uniref:Uncharacterized protein n=1 Tax=Mesorhizobium onobrychidis TaxID=2775404 RepID=A0ABY5QR59_9HYPH|nr:hypothetical protein [Mesorhizobium onobrychidis]UVC13656.1 hypothetical protein IHQ72_23475 [Mesorhizobium onobrychidis]
MSGTGWQIAVEDRGKTRHFIVGVRDKEVAQAKVLAQCESVTVLSQTKLTEEDFDKLGLVDAVKLKRQAGTEIMSTRT